MPITLHRRNSSPIPHWDFPAHHHHAIPKHHRRWERTHRRLIPCYEQPGYHQTSQTHHQTPFDSIRSRRLITVRRRVAPSHSLSHSCRCSRWRWLWPCLHIYQSAPRSERKDQDKRRREHPYSYVKYDDPADYFGRSYENGRWREGGDGVRGRDRRGSFIDSPYLPPQSFSSRPQPPLPPLPRRAAPPSPPPRFGRPYQREMRREMPSRSGACSCPSCVRNEPDLIDQLCTGVDSLRLAPPRGRPALLATSRGGGIIAPPNSRLASRVPSVAPRSPSRASRLGRGLRSRSRRPYHRRGQDSKAAADLWGDGGRHGEWQLGRPSFAGLLDTPSDDDEWQDRGRQRERRRSDRREGGRAAARRTEEVLEESSDLQAWNGALVRRRVR